MDKKVKVLGFYVDKGGDEYNSWDVYIALYDGKELYCYNPQTSHSKLQFDYMMSCKEITEEQYLTASSSFHTPKEYLTEEVQEDVYIDIWTTSDHDIIEQTGGIDLINMVAEEHSNFISKQPRGVHVVNIEGDKIDIPFIVATNQCSFGLINYLQEYIYDVLDVNKSDVCGSVMTTEGQYFVYSFEYPFTDMDNATLRVHVVRA